MSDYSTIGVFILLTLLFPVAAMAGAWLFRPKPPATTEKMLPYECGVDTQGPSWMQFRVNFFLYALVFLAFDVETIFLFPGRLNFRAWDSLLSLRCSFLSRYWLSDSGMPGKKVL